jgi:hypothetical protein
VSDHEPDVEADPGDLEPTDNSAGAPVDLDRVRELEEGDDAAGQ